MNPGLVLIFDMDGVIVDSNPVHRAAWTEFNRQYGVETTESMHVRMYGKHNGEIVRDFYGSGLSPEEVAARGAAKELIYRKMAGRRLEKLLVPGIRQFLENRREVPMAVATNAESANVGLVLDGAGLRPYFRAVVDASQVSRPKPDPEIYLRAADILRTPPANCIVLEDSHSGVEAARAAGARVIGLRTTHVNLPGTAINVDNFLSRDLDEWLDAQTRAV